MRHAHHPSADRPERGNLMSAVARLKRCQPSIGMNRATEECHQKGRGMSNSLGSSDRTNRLRFGDFEGEGIEVAELRRRGVRIRGQPVRIANESGTELRDAFARIACDRPPRNLHAAALFSIRRQEPSGSRCERRRQTLRDFSWASSFSWAQGSASSAQLILAEGRLDIFCCAVRWLRTPSGAA